MEPDFNKPVWKDSRINHSLPPNYRGYILRGAQITHAVASAGVIIFQDIIYSPFQIHFRALHLSEPVNIPVIQQNAFIASFLAIKNSIQFAIKGLGRLRLLPGQFALIHCREQTGVMEFETGGEYQSLEISWSRKLAEEALPYFPVHQSELEKEKPSTFFLPGGEGSPASARTLDIAYSILKSPYDDAVSQLYFEHKVREYLISLLSTSAKEPVWKVRISPEEYESVLALAEKLRHQPDQKFPIAALSKEVGMNEMKLKIVFKELFGQGIFEFQLDQRMKEAHRLLEETDLNTKAIAARVGYRLTTSFITKFREYFGYPPSTVSRRK